ncbi:MAG TPA: MarR family transcriptional regulator [Phenylobacterium sp.]
MKPPSAGSTARRGARLPTAYYKPVADFRQALREFLAFSDEGARSHGLTPQQHQALLAIKSHLGPTAMSISELAERLMIKTHSAVGLVGRLVERDLVARRPSPEDRRRVLLELRPHGEQVIETITMSNLEQLNRLAQILAELLKTVRRIERDTTAKAWG